ARAGEGVTLSPNATARLAARSRVLANGCENQRRVIEGVSLRRVVSAEPGRPGGEAALVEPGRRPVGATRGDQRLQVPTRLLHRGTGIGGEEAQRHGAEPELKQPAAARGLEVVVPLGGGPGDDRNLPLVQAEVAVQGRLRRRPRIGVREEIGRAEGRERVWI